MKRPLQLSLAIALALGGTNALALGLGPVQVHSKLNEPLNIEIPVIQGSAGEAEGLLVSLASSEDFDRIGLNRSRLRIPLEFAVAKNAQGATVIKVTSQEPVRETFLDFLVEANWPKGRLLREYTVLLDPPLTAPSRATAAAAPRATPAPATTQPMREPAKAPVAAAPAPSPRPSAPAAAAPKISDGEYGPVGAGETLSAIARQAGAGSNLNQMMLALLKSNPDAFYKNNINALKRGAILRIPTSAELEAAGSAREAAAAVQAQVEDWRGGRASPVLVADAAEAAVAAPPAKPRKASAKVDDERLELVPPKAGADSLAMADSPGKGAGSGSAARELKSELSRTRESLTARDQEAGELKVQVKQLEDLQSKNDRLISLKDSEIADLQQKLKQLQTGAKPSASVAPAAASAPPPASAAAPAAAAPAGIDKKDIWGEPAATPPAAAKAEPASPTAAVATPAATDTGTDVVTAEAPPATPTPKALATNVTADPAPAAEPAKDGAAVTPAAAPVASPGAAATAAATPAPGTDKKTADAPAKPVKPVAAAPVASEPWYDAMWVKAALGAGVLGLLLGLLGLRKRKADPGKRESIADSFGDSPLGAANGGDAEAFDGEEQDLRAQLSEEPDNLGLHLELLSVFYARRESEKFEQQAAVMHSYVVDPQQIEWVEAQSLGREFAPHNPLFGQDEHYRAADASSEPSHFDSLADIGGLHAGDVHHPVAGDGSDFDFDSLNDDLHTASAPSLHGTATKSDMAFGLHVDDLDTATLPAPPASAGAASEGYDFDGLAPLDFDPQPSHHDVSEDLTPVSPPAAQDLILDDDFFPGEDAVGTKLDLARAYLDMGDPEGARSMLEEVIAEGNDEQQATAHRLMAELR